MGRNAGFFAKVNDSKYDRASAGRRHNGDDGDDFGSIVAAAVGGKHRGSPLGIADVELEGGVWSIKT